LGGAGFFVCEKPKGKVDRNAITAIADAKFVIRWLMAERISWEDKGGTLCKMMTSRDGILYP
jgi:hypothetical protein